MSTYKVHKTTDRIAAENNLFVTPAYNLFGDDNGQEISIDNALDDSDAGGLLGYKVNDDKSYSKVWANDFGTIQPKDAPSTLKNEQELRALLKRLGDEVTKQGWGL